MPGLKTTKRVSRLPIVFLGPSLARNQAGEILAAEYRPPIRRGDLEGVPSGSVVAIIDGVFDQNLSVSPTEIRAALRKNIVIYGASSMGALRAVEVPGVTGVGRVYEMFRSGAIDGDDEVALIFDPETMRPLCEPLVNIRHALAQLATPGTISRELAAAILSAARKLPYFDRSYPLILQTAGLKDRNETRQLATMLASYDLKREDAITLLEQLRAFGANHSAPRSPKLREPALIESIPNSIPSGAVHCWEFGPPLPFRELVEFLSLTGSISKYAVRAFARMGSEKPDFTGPVQPSSEALFARLLAQTARAWQWATEEEVNTSLDDLGLEYPFLDEALKHRVELEQCTMALVRAQDTRFLEMLRVELFLDDLALKREIARALNLLWLSKRGEYLSKEKLSREEKDSANNALCRLLDVRNPRMALEQLSCWGLAPETVQQFIQRLAYARRLVERRPRGPRVTVRPRHRWLQPSAKAAGSKRFCTSLVRAYGLLKKLKPVVGITRVAVITRLRTIGIPNAQAFRPDGEWSSTVGSGKSESTVGAKVGAMMEEIEKWAQEQFARRKHYVHEQMESLQTLRHRRERVIDPFTLDLPYDSCYTPDLALGWTRCVDLLQGGTVLIPNAAVTHRRVANDIYYSTRGGRKTVTTNGLASGMTIAEALTHALCEYIERHALVIDAVAGGNPGGPTLFDGEFIDLETAPRSTRRLMGKISRAGYRLTVRDITSNIRVPTFNATIYLPEGSVEGQIFNDGWQRASGWAAHPDPETALNMSILEASQTIMTHVAGAREDLVLKARSLGRHERTESRRWAAVAAEMNPDAPRRSFATVFGLSSQDAAEDVRWILRRLSAAGCDHCLIADYSIPEIAPVKVVRAIIPGLETINPFHTGLSARRALLSDMLPSVGSVPT